MNRIFYFIGQPGAGKTTLAKRLISHLEKNSFHIDGDDIREIFNNKDYSESGRRNNIQRAHDIARFISSKGKSVVMSLVSPYSDLRDSFKLNNLVVEIYVHTSDDRGRNSYHVKNFEKPSKDYIDVDTSGKSEDEAFDDMLNQINQIIYAD